MTKDEMRDAMLDFLETMLDEDDDRVGFEESVDCEIAETKRVVRICEWKLNKLELWKKQLKEETK